MKYNVTLNGKTYEVEVEKGQAVVLSESVATAPVAPVAAPVQAPVAAPAATPAPAAAPVAGGEVVECPLPGKVVDIKVSEGQAVKKGDILVIIEAMKMENEVVAAHDATIKQIVASKGSMVQSGDALVVLA